jgi:predicted nucleotidyltransferase
LGSGHASGILRDLTASGVLLTRDQGRVNTYELAPPSSLITRHLKGLFAAEAERRHEVVRGLSEAVPGMVSLILFGSEARGDATPGSDTDLLVVVERKTKRLEEQIGEVCLRLATEHQLDLTWLVTDQEQVRGWEADGSEFWRNVRSEGIALAGTTVERLAR